MHVCFFICVREAYLPLHLCDRRTHPLRMSTFFDEEPDESLFAPGEDEEDIEEAQAAVKEYEATLNLQRAAQQTTRGKAANSASSAPHAVQATSQVVETASVSTQCTSSLSTVAARPLQVACSLARHACAVITHPVKTSSASSSADTSAPGPAVQLPLVFGPTPASTPPPIPADRSVQPCTKRLRLFSKTPAASTSSDPTKFSCAEQKRSGGGRETSGWRPSFALLRGGPSRRRRPRGEEDNRQGALRESQGARAASPRRR